MGFFQPGIKGVMPRTKMGVRNTVPSRMARMVPLGDFHISFRWYSQSRFPPLSLLFGFQLFSLCPFSFTAGPIFVPWISFLSCLNSIFPLLNPSPAVCVWTWLLPAGWEHQLLSPTHRDSWTAPALVRFAFTSTAQHDSKSSANPDGDVTRLECIYYVNCF